MQSAPNLYDFRDSYPILPLRGALFVPGLLACTIALHVLGLIRAWKMDRHSQFIVLSFSCYYHTNFACDMCRPGLAKFGPADVLALKDVPGRS